MHVASPQMALLWLSMKVVSGYTVLFGSRIINCSQEEAFGNLLSRLADRGSQVLREAGWSCDFFFLLFLPATRVYFDVFVIKASLSNKH